MTNASNKSSIREHYLNKRKTLSTDFVESKSQILCDLLYEFIVSYTQNPLFGSKCFNVGIFSAIGNEPNLKVLFHSLAKTEQFEASYPLIIDLKNGHMVFKLMKVGDQLGKGAMGIEEPKDNALSTIIPDIVLVPGICFDSFGHRVGFGRGFYDQYFHKNNVSLKIGVCFQELTLDKSSWQRIEADPHDIPVDFIATEEGVKRCEK